MQNNDHKTVSWCLLTYGRAAVAQKTFPYCLQNAGYPIEEIVWCDNFSSLEERKQIEAVVDSLDKPTTKIFFPRNMGVAKGYNATVSQARSEYLVITGMDCFMPSNWLADMMDVLQNAPDCGASMIYTQPIEKVSERIRGPEFNWHGKRLQEAMMLGRRLIKTSMQREIGYFNEMLGLYGHDDICMSNTAERIFKENGLKPYCLLDMPATHLGTEGIVMDHAGQDGDPAEYWKFKNKEATAPWKSVFVANHKANGAPRFSPF